jgi:hypothetical protein
MHFVGNSKLLEDGSHILFTPIARNFHLKNYANWKNGKSAKIRTL